LVSVTRKPTYDAGDVGKILTMPEKNSVQPVDLEDQKESAVTAGRIKK
jgi:hypothetical protein